jgi:hypothetical protein
MPSSRLDCEATSGTVWVFSELILFEICCEKLLSA